MPSRRPPPPSPPFVCHANRLEHKGDAPPAASFVTAQGAHPGWQRAAEILLTGLARLEAREKEAARQSQPEDKAA